jgi:hypothetical protein
MSFKPSAPRSNKPFHRDAQLKLNLPRFKVLYVTGNFSSVLSQLLRVLRNCKLDKDSPPSSISTRANRIANHSVDSSGIAR